MANQTNIKPKGSIKDLKIFVHAICILTFIVIQNNVLDSNYFMLLGHPWLKDVKISHDWGSNTIIIKDINTIKTIPIIKKLGVYIK
jgi:hypothetical protein